MNDLVQKLILSIAGAMIGGVFTYGLKAVSIEGRLDGIERAVMRIENKLK